MKRWLVLFLTLCLAVSCASVSAAAEDARPEGDPWGNSDICGLWPSERPAPEEQYTLWANYDYYMQVQETGDGTSSNPFDRTTKWVMERLLEYCETTRNTDAESECLRILYDYSRDRETLEKDGFASLMAYVDRVKAVRSLDELTALMEEEGFLFGSPFFEIRLNPFRDPDGERQMYCIMIDKAAAAEEKWPTEEELAANPEAMPVKDTEKVLRRLLRMQYGEEEAARLVEKIIWFDSFYPAEYTPSERENELGGRLALTLEEIRELCPPLAAMLKGMGFVKEDGEGTAAYHVMTIDLAAFREAYTEENLELFKAEIALSMYEAAEGILGSAAFPEAAENNDPAYFLRLVPVVVYAQAYVHNLIPEERVKGYYQLVDELREAMHARIKQSDWISPETKEKAFEKLDKIKAVSLVYEWEADCEPLRTALRSCDNLLEAESRCILFSRKEDMRYAGMDVFRGNRKTSTERPLSAGGLYYPWENAIYIGAGALTGEVYNGASRETVLATLGWTIAHELSHGFDTNGMMYDAEGRQNPIWTEADRQTYMERAYAVADRASRIELLDGVNVPGRQQISEIIADTEGLRLVLDLAAKEENFDYDAFFRACAQFYSGYFTDRETYARTFGELEVHPAFMVRVNFTLQLMDEFYATYPSVTEGTPMYLPPEERELVW